MHLSARHREIPEDVGDPRGYAELLAAIHDPKHERNAEISDWIEDGFDPNVVDANLLSKAVTALAKHWSRKPAAKHSRPT